MAMIKKATSTTRKVAKAPAKKAAKVTKKAIVKAPAKKAVVKRTKAATKPAASSQTEELQTEQAIENLIEELGGGAESEQPTRAGSISPLDEFCNEGPRSAEPTEREPETVHLGESVETGELGDVIAELVQDEGDNGGDNEDDDEDFDEDEDGDDLSSDDDEDDDGGCAE